MLAEAAVSINLSQTASRPPAVEHAGAVSGLRRAAPWLLLFGRTLLFFAVQAAFALGFFLAGSPAAWEAGADWWPLTVAIANALCLAALAALYRAEGRSYWGVFRFQREHVKNALLVMLGTFVLAGPVAILPNILLSQWLFGDSQAVLPLFVRPLPAWAAYAGLVLFPVTQGLTEAALYFAYVMPRLFGQNPEARPSWLALSLAALMLGLQHLAMPFLFDPRFIAWRALMYLPFAFVTGLLLRWRPRLLPYFAIVHTLMNLSLAAMFLPAA